MCPKLKRPLYICNGCEGFRKCFELKQVYDARLAEKTCRTTLSESRAGINLTDTELEELDLLITPLMRSFLAKAGCRKIACGNPEDLAQKQ
ncbi:MAG: hypothetical protein ACOYEQ_02650 [Bacillota bacterium]